MNEASKNYNRRIENGDFKKFFAGLGIDIGCGHDPVTPNCALFDKEQGDAQDMSGFLPGAFDWVHSSHCLEHLDRPDVALKQWWRLIRPGGHLIVTVPDVALYEKWEFPSRFNSDHKHHFCFASLLDLFTTLEGCQLVRIQLNDEGFDYEDLESDQTRKGAQAEIEVIARKVVNRFWAP